MAKVYIKAINEWVETTKEFHDDYYRGVNAHRRTQQNHGNCSLPRKMYWYCDENCAECKYCVSTDMDSLDRTIGEDEECTFHDIISDEYSDIEEIAADRITMGLLLKRLEELMPEAIRIGEMRESGMNETEISKEMGMARTTMRSRLDRLAQVLSKEFPEIFEKISSI